METAAHFKAQLAYGSRRDVGYPPERLAELRNSYYSARLVENIRTAIEQAGPLSPDQAQEITHIVRGSTTASADLTPNHLRRTKQ